MSKVVLDVSMSLDGFTAGPNVREAEPMGDGGANCSAGPTAGGNGVHSWTPSVNGLPPSASRCSSAW
jgi:hypothetical protein